MPPIPHGLSDPGVTVKRAPPPAARGGTGTHDPMLGPAPTPKPAAPVVRTAPDPTTTPLTDQQIRAQAAAEVANQIQQQTAPLNADVNQLQTEQGQATTDVSNMFSSLLPYVKASAEATTQDYNQAQQAQAGIFSQYGQSLNQFSQGLASKAQQLAQQMGGPVSANEFTAAAQGDQAAYPGYQAGSLLNSLSLAQSGEQAAQAFAGRVFPALAAEQASKVRTTFQNQITNIRDQIRQLEATKTNAFTDKYNTLLQNQQQFKLDLAKGALDKLNADRNWAATKATVALEQRKLDLSIAAQQHQNWLDEQRVHQGDVTLSQGQQRINQNWKTLAIEDKRINASLAATAKAYNINVLRLKNQWGHYRDMAIVANNKIKLTQQQDAASYIDSATQGSKPVTGTQIAPVPYNPVHPNANAFMMRDPKNPKQWIMDPQHPGQPQLFITRTVHSVPASAQPLTDPTAVYRYVLAHQPYADPRMVAMMVRTRFGLPASWKPGGKVPVVGATPPKTTAGTTAQPKGPGPVVTTTAPGAP